MVRIGLIGCGRWGKNHAKVLSELPCTFVGIADPNPDIAKTCVLLKTQYFNNVDELLSSVDAISIAAPTVHHFSIVHRALTMGKHVLVEKPVTLDSVQTRELVSLAATKKLILSVGYIFRFHPTVLALKALLQAAPDIYYIQARYIGGQNRLWADSGAILNFGIHLIDILNFVLHSRPVRVYAKRQNMLDAAREDSASVTLVYPDFFATLELSCIHPEKHRDMWVHSRTRSMFADFDAQTLESHEHGRDGVALASAGVLGQGVERSNPLFDQFRYFLRCVESYDQHTFQDVANIGREESDTTKICELAIRSAQKGCELEIH